MTLQAIGCRRVQPEGELRARIEASLGRLEADDFRPERVYRGPEYDWPGDQEGRTLLALVMLAQAAGREPRYMRDILDPIDGALNARGYFGRVLPEGELDEQQLAGNSWFLRALCEYWEWTKDEAALKRIERLTRELILPTKGRYAAYPTRPEQRVFAGEASGTLLGETVDGWYLSTDIGCAFIMLDGASHAFRLLRWPELGELIEEMIRTFAAIDFRGASMQTHATLSGLRGLLRYCEDAGRPGLLAQAKSIFALYAEHGMTENYANYNWFGRPDWTEPCAVVDAYLAAVDLWRLTGESAYMNAAHHIYYNGIGHGQRPNGGFGCDCCSGAREPYLYPLPNVFEAWWCCTMRGGDGLSRAASHALFEDGDAIVVPFFHAFSARLDGPGGALQVEAETGYPLEGWLRIGLEGEADARQWRLYLPEWVDRASLRLAADDGQAGVTVDGDYAVFDGARRSIELRFDIGLRTEPVVGAHALQGGYGSFRYGTLLLGLHGAEEEVVLGEGAKLVPGERAGEFRLFPSGEADEASAESESGAGTAAGAGYELKPFNGLFRLSTEEALGDRKQILFRTNA